MEVITLNDVVVVWSLVYTILRQEGYIHEACESELSISGFPGSEQCVPCLHTFVLVLARTQKILGFHVNESRSFARHGFVD